jgi:conjugal transfer pilus assembly protein TraB
MADRPDSGNKNQRYTQVIIIGVACIIFLAFILLVAGGNDDVANANAGDRFRIISDDQAAKTHWVGEAGEEIKKANEKVSALEAQNRALKERLDKIENNIKNAPNDRKSGESTTTPARTETVRPYPPIPTGDATPVTAQPQPPQSWGDSFVQRNMMGSSTTSTDSSGVPLVKREKIVQYQPIQAALASVKTGESKIEKKNEIEPNKLPPIPAGTIIPVVAITGVDAPTLSVAKSQPLPMLWRVTDLSIIPNANQLDLVGCHILSEAAGDLSSERVLIRTNTITCTNEEGTLFETELSGYAASGTDSKNGIRGRLVSKQGALLANVLTASFLDGVAQAFSTKDQITMASALGTTTTTTSNDKELLEASAYRGVSSAMARLSDFYMDMAEQTFPVIELPGGVEADIIVTATQSLTEQQPTPTTSQNAPKVVQ